MSIKNNHWILGLNLCIIALILFGGYKQAQIKECTLRLSLLQKQSRENLKRLINHMSVNVGVSIDSLEGGLYPYKNKLIYRFSEDMCDECINEDIKALMRSNIGTDNVFMLPTYHLSRSNAILLNNKLAHFSHENILFYKWRFPIHRETGLEQRYFAFVNSNGNITSVFFPIKNGELFTDLYLELIKEKLK